LVVVILVGGKIWVGMGSFGGGLGLRRAGVAPHETEHAPEGRQRLRWGLKVASTTTVTSAGAGAGTTLARRVPASRVDKR
jgi:hypothetical protein